LEYTPLLESDAAKAVFPEDVIGRAKELYAEIGSIGAYSHSQGVPFIRKNVAQFIESTSPPSAYLCALMLMYGWIGRS